MKPGR